LGNENSDAGDIKRSHGQQAPQPWSTWLASITH